MGCVLIGMISSLPTKLKHFFETQNREGRGDQSKRIIIHLNKTKPSECIKTTNCKTGKSLHACRFFPYRQTSGFARFLLIMDAADGKAGIAMLCA
jgi:hypothetical protein